MARILAVCTGNICRSPMVEGLIRDRLQQRGIEGIEVESAGVSGFDESPATPESVQALSELGIDISGHQARRVRRQMMESADLILCLAAEHRDAVWWLAPEAAGRAFTMKELAFLLDEAAANGSDRGPRSEDPSEQLAAAVRTADRVRQQEPPSLLDEDVADPLGLSIESYRATAWEVETLTDRIMDHVFGPSEGESGSTGPGPEGSAVTGAPGGAAWEQARRGTTRGGER